MYKMKKIFYLCCLLLVSSCTVGRFIAHGGPDGNDYDAFVQDTIKAGDKPFVFAIDTTSRLSELIKGGNIRLTSANRGDTIYSIKCSFDNFIRMRMLNDLPIEANNDDSFKQIMPKNKVGGSFILIENDTIKYARSSSGTDLYTPYLAYSVTKSITSLLCGIAVDKGYIASVQDPVTKYIPELSAKDALWDDLTIEHLLDMRSGLDLKESYSANPFSKMARLFYGANQNNVIDKLGFYTTPGNNYNYLSITTAVLGEVLERALDCSLAEFATKYVWQPMGMEHNASFSLDSRRKQNAKTFMGLTTNVMDLAKIGRLYLNGGNWNGVQIVSKEWVDRSTNPEGSNREYAYQWWIGEETIKDSSGDTRYFNDSAEVENYLDSLGIHKEQASIKESAKHKGKFYVQHYCNTNKFYALGIMSQLLYIDKTKNVIVVRLGADYIDYDIYTQVSKLLNNILGDYFNETK